MLQRLLAAAVGVVAGVGPGRAVEPGTVGPPPPASWAPPGVDLNCQAKLNVFCNDPIKDGPQHDGAYNASRAPFFGLYDHNGAPDGAPRAVAWRCYSHGCLNPTTHRFDKSIAGPPVKRRFACIECDGLQHRHRRGPWRTAGHLRRMRRDDHRRLKWTVPAGATHLGVRSEAPPDPTSRWQTSCVHCHWKFHHHREHGCDLPRQRAARWNTRGAECLGGELRDSLRSNVSCRQSERWLLVCRRRGCRNNLRLHGWQSILQHAAGGFFHLAQAQLGRRPYIEETTGSILLRTDSQALGGASIAVEAYLPCVPGSHWAWPNVTGGSDVLLPLSLSKLPANVHNDICVVVTLPSGEQLNLWRRFLRVPPPKADSTATIVQVDHEVGGGLLVSTALNQTRSPLIGVGYCECQYE